MTELAEMSVIGGLLMFPKETKEAFHLLEPLMFAQEGLAEAFRVCRTLWDTEKPYDIVSVEDKLGKEARIMLVNCCQTMPSVVGFGYYCEMVRENWRKRTLCGELGVLSAECAMPLTTARGLTEQLATLLERQRTIEKVSRDDTAKSFSDSILQYMDSLIRPDDAIKTGWSDFDFCTGGLQRKGFYIISARSGKGKTDFALNLATNLATRYGVYYCTMEMSREQLMQRIASRLGHINSARLRDHQLLTPEEMQTVLNLFAALTEKTRLTLDDQQRIGITNIEEKLLRHSPDVIVLDHVGLMRHDTSKRNQWEAIADTSQRLKELAMKYNIAVVALVQEGRSADRAPEASTAHLRGSDNLSNDSDGIFQLKPDPVERMIRNEEWLKADVCVTKNRHGSTGKLAFHWQPQYHCWDPVRHQSRESGRFYA